MGGGGGGGPLTPLVRPPSSPPSTPTLKLPHFLSQLSTALRPWMDQVVCSPQTTAATSPRHSGPPPPLWASPRSPLPSRCCSQRVVRLLCAALRAPPRLRLLLKCARKAV